MNKNRIEAFTDAVLAIIITIMVLEITPPSGPNWTDLYNIKHKIIVYVSAFVILSVYWITHHNMFQIVKKVNTKVLWANNFLLFLLSLFPIATSWVGNWIFELAPQIFYGVLLFLTNIAYYILGYYLQNANKYSSKNNKIINQKTKHWLTITGNIVAILAGIAISPVLIIVINSIVISTWLIPNKKIEAYTENHN